MPAKQMAIERAWRNNGATHRPIMLAIAGDSAAGKTTLTRGLVEALGPGRATSMCVDDYHRYDRVERKTRPMTPLHPDCNYLDIMEQHLQLLAVGQPILKPVYNHHEGTLDRPVLVEPHPFITVEGLFPLYSKLSRACFDVTVFLDPPESIRREWKVRRDTEQRGYETQQVLDDLDRREPDSAAYIRPQRQNADIVVRFSPIEERGESERDPLSATLLLRPTIEHPGLAEILADVPRDVMHLKLSRDDDGKPVDALHIHGYADPEVARHVEESIWKELRVAEPLPENLGAIGPEARSVPLALTQLILLFHLHQAAGTLDREVTETTQLLP